jgi:hypothetical protein
MNHIGNCYKSLNNLIMKPGEIVKYLTFSTFIVVLLFVLITCKKKEEAITCNLACDINQPSVGMTIIYTAGQTGDGTMVSLSYATNSGTTTINNPSLPWSDTVFVSANTNVTISGTGSVTNGTLQVAYKGTEGGVHIEGSNSCSHQTE